MAEQANSELPELSQEILTGVLPSVRSWRLGSFDGFGRYFGDFGDFWADLLHQRCCLQLSGGFEEKKK